MISPFSISRLGVGLGPSYLSAIGFKGTGAPTQDGRSGYWRLFYYQLQEAELEKEKQKREQEQGQKAPEGKSEAASQATPAVPKPKAKPRVAKPKPVEVLPKVHPRPLYNKVPEPVSIEPWLHVVSNQFRAEYLSILPLQKIVLLQKAANDEEEEVLTLLLMAA